MTLDEQIAELKARIARESDRIDAAYWTFTRTARGKPPILAVPDAYAERTRLLAELDDLIRLQRMCYADREP